MYIIADGALLAIEARWLGIAYGVGKIDGHGIEVARWRLLKHFVRPGDEDRALSKIFHSKRVPREFLSGQRYELEMVWIVFHQEHPFSS